MIQLGCDEIINKIKGFFCKRVDISESDIVFIVHRILDLIDYEGKKELKLMERQNKLLISRSGGYGRFNPCENKEAGKQSTSDVPQF
jgi:hypothetical protein